MTAITSRNESVATPQQIMPSGFTIEAAAVYAGLSYATVKRLIRSGKLPHSKIGQEIVVRRAAIDRLLHETQVVNHG